MFRPGFVEDYVHPSTTSRHDLRGTFHWNAQLKAPEFCAAPVTAFRHVNKHN